MQSQSIKDLGTPEQVARMILPRGSEVVSYSSQQYTQPDRDLIDLALTQPRQQSYRRALQGASSAHFGPI